MTQEELERYVELDCKFVSECERVCKQLAKYDGEFSEVYRFTISDNEVYATGGYSCMGEYPLELLTYTDEELEKHVNGLIEEQKHKDELKRIESEAKEKESDLKEYNRLKKKLGL